MFPKLKIETPKSESNLELLITYSKVNFLATSYPNLEIKERYESPNSGLSYHDLIFKIGWILTEL